MRPRQLAPLAAIAVLAAACSAGGGTPAPASVAPSEAAPASTAPTRIEVQLTDALRIEPTAMTVPAGQPVTFVVANTGTMVHEFVLGDEAAQAEHEQEMIDEGGMAMPEDEPMAISVEPGETKELSVIFDEPGSIFAGCHVAGHYAAGMKAAVTVE